MVLPGGQGMLEGVLALPPNQAVPGRTARPEICRFVVRSVRLTAEFEIPILIGVVVPRRFQNAIHLFLRRCPIVRVRCQSDVYNLDHRNLLGSTLPSQQAPHDSVVCLSIRLCFV